MRFWIAKLKSKEPRFVSFIQRITKLFMQWQNFEFKILQIFIWFAIIQIYNIWPEVLPGVSSTNFSTSYWFYSILLSYQIYFLYTKARICNLNSLVSLTIWKNYRVLMTVLWFYFNVTSMVQCCVWNVYVKIELLS